MRSLHLPDAARWKRLVAGVPLPRWLPVRQAFANMPPVDVAATVRRELSRPEITALIRPGALVALGVGSRGLASLVEVVRSTVSALHEAGCEPFVVPAMGSHGGATAEGQRAVLASLGVTEESVGAPIRAGMDAVEIGRLKSGLPVYFSREALEANLIVPINRVKPHTSFRGALESGLAKMLTIGFGKHEGATAMHSAGWDMLEANIREALEIVKAKTPLGFGLATVEDAGHGVAFVGAVKAEEMPGREEELLAWARELMPRLPFEQAGVLVIGEIGKDISGTGMDPNVTGRLPGGAHLPGGPRVGRIVVLGLSPASHGNGTGIGMADVTTERALAAIDLDKTWLNVLTSTNLSLARLPVAMPTDRAAIQLALKCCGQADTARAQLAYIRNTLELGEIYLSEALWEQACLIEGVERLGPTADMRFDGAGNLLVDEQSWSR